MLAEFVVENFRSIRNEVRLSMEAWSGDKEHSEATMVPFDPETLMEPKKKINLLKIAAIYGPNNCGKSNLLHAAMTMKRCVVNSANIGEDQIQNGIQPFRLDSQTIDKPTTFEVTFYVGIAKYTYGFIIDCKKVHEEWLYAWPTGSGPRQVWLKRTSSEYSEKTWYFGPKLTGMTRSAQQAYKANKLFLSVANTLNNEKIQPLINWFKNKFSFMDSSRDWTMPQFKVQFKKDNVFAEWMKRILVTSDLRINKLDVIDPDKLELIKFPDQIPEEFKNHVIDLQRLEQTRVQIFRPVRGMPDSRTQIFDLERDESKGTQRLITLLSRLYQVIQGGEVFWVDEIESKLHMMQVKRLVELMQFKKFNPNGAQLIFTSHQALLLDPSIFRRDQIYLMDCDSDGVSSLASLLEFKTRKNEPWCKGYLSGRYGAVPYLESLVDLNIEHRKLSGASHD